MLNNKNIRTRIALLIWLILDWNFKKTVVIFEISTLEFIKNEFLTNTVNVGIGSTFSKRPGSPFLEDPDSGPGPLFKVCHVNLHESFNEFG